MRDQIDRSIHGPTLLRKQQCRRPHDPSPWFCFSAKSCMHLWNGTRSRQLANSGYEPDHPDRCLTATTASLTVFCMQLPGRLTIRHAYSKSMKEIENNLSMTASRASTTTSLPSPGLTTASRCVTPNPSLLQAALHSGNSSGWKAYESPS